MTDDILYIGGGDIRASLRAKLRENFNILDNRTKGWEDLRFPASTLNPPGSVSDADIDVSTVFMGTLLFDAGSTEIVVGQAQLPHAKKLDTILYPHIHWSPTSTDDGDVYWRFEYIMADKDEVFPTEYTVLNSLATSSGVVGTHQTHQLGEIDTTGLGISAMIIWKLSRIGGDVTDTYTDDARLLEFDIHYEVDEVGSTLITSK